MTPDITAPTTSPARKGDREASRTRLDNVRAFEARLGTGAAAFPGLRHERTGTSIEWFLRASRSLKGEGVPLTCSLVVDVPCDEDTAALLDAMAYADDPGLGRRELDAALRGERGFLNGVLANAVEFARTLARRDLALPGVDARAYGAALARALSRPVDLFPAGCEDDGRDYRPGQHLRERVREACAAALKAAREGAPSGGAKTAGKGRRRPGGVTRNRAPAKAGRPFRMRRYSALYD